MRVRIQSFLAGFLLTLDAVNVMALHEMVHIQSTTRRNSHYKDLSIFLTLPFELILEILAHIHPIALYVLRGVNNLFRACLSSTASNSIWIRSFYSSSLPRCPVDMDGWKWARFLFSDSSCAVRIYMFIALVFATLNALSTGLWPRKGIL